VLVTVAETARALNIGTEDLIYRYLRTGVLRGRKVDGRWEVDPAIRFARSAAAFDRLDRLNATARLRSFRGGGVVRAVNLTPEQVETVVRHLGNGSRIVEAARMRSSRTRRWPRTGRMAAPTPSRIATRPRPTSTARRRPRGRATSLRRGRERRQRLGLGSPPTFSPT
jgi:hypothetical protein